MKQAIFSWFGAKPQRPNTPSSSNLPPVPALPLEALKPTRFGMAVSDKTARRVVWFPDPGPRPEPIVITLPGGDV